MAKLARNLALAAMTDAARFLGFAFANADFLFEVNEKGTVVFATGAAREFVPGSADIVGTPAARLFHTTEAIRFATLSRSLAGGDRAGPFQLKLAGGKDVALSLFRLPENGARVSCTFSGTQPRPGGTADCETGLSTRDAFLAAAAATAGESDALAMVEVPGLPKFVTGLSEENSGKLFARIGAALAGLGAKAAGRLSPSSFGIIADAAGGAARLGPQIRAALAESGAGALGVEETLIALKGKELSEGQRGLVLRYVVEKFAGGHWTAGSRSDAAAQFGAMIEDTQLRLRQMTETVADGAFQIAYQPIVKLATGALSHYEALTRFSGDTGETIRFVEALGIFDAFDLAVAMKVLTTVEGRASHGQHIAFNVSGRTISAAANFGLLAGLLARKRALAGRVLVEITETAAIENLVEAGKAVSAMQALGYRVGIDDFGAGAASVNYLHALGVDFVKFDGALIQRIGQSRRDDTLLAGLVKLCRELGVETVAEFIETQEQASAALAMGFDLGQGRLFGMAAAEIAPPGVRIAAKRKGIQESWG